jgi:penicillin-binding protein activator
MSLAVRSLSLVSCLVLLLLAAVTGCARTRTSYADPLTAAPMTAEWEAGDLHQIAEKMVDSLLSTPAVVQATAQRAPVVSVGKVKNKTMQHIDTESLGDTIRTRLMRSGKFQFVDRSTDDQAEEELKFQKDSGMVDPQKAVATGQQSGAEYLLTANLSEIANADGRTKDVFYKFTMNLKNLRTGLLEWSEEKELRKISTKKRFGF